MSVLDEKKNFSLELLLGEREAERERTGGGHTGCRCESEEGGEGEKDSSGEHGAPLLSRSLKGEDERTITDSQYLRNISTENQQVAGWLRILEAVVRGVVNPKPYLLHVPLYVRNTIMRGEIKLFALHLHTNDQKSNPQVRLKCFRKS